MVCKGKPVTPELALELAQELAASANEAEPAAIEVFS